jgi:hypothetical protein
MANSAKQNESGEQPEYGPEKEIRSNPNNLNKRKWDR